MTVLTIWITSSVDNPHVTVHLDLVVDSHGDCRGAQVLLLLLEEGDDTRVVALMEAQMTVLATGGVGDLVRRSMMILILIFDVCVCVFERESHIYIYICR